MCLAGLLHLALWLVPDPLAASCTPPEPAVLWSFPADGATDVPTNADLWLTGNHLGTPSLDGKLLDENGSGGFELGALMPEHEYSVTIPTSESAGAPTTLSLTFKTGTATQAEGALTPEQIPTITRNPDGRPSYFLPRLCPLAPSQGCFDTGPPTRARWEVGTPPVAWILKRRHCGGNEHTMVWPVECGAPVLEFYEGGIACAQVALTDGSTVGPATDLFCTVPPADAALLSTSSCSENWPPMAAVLVADPETKARSPASEAGSSPANASTANASRVDGGTADGSATDRGQPGAAQSATDAAETAGQGGCSVAGGIARDTHKSSSKPLSGALVALCAAAAGVRVASRRWPREKR